MKKIIVFSLLMVSFLFSAAAPVFAGTSACPSGGICISNPLDVDTPQALIGRVINSILGIVGSLALVMFIYGGLIWMTSSGSSDKVKQGRDIILWAAIGLVIIFSAYGLVRFVIQGVGA